MLFDCFMFFNELDMLELRLNLLDGVVDKFVIVESEKTLKGLDKPLYYAENKKRFSRFQRKIIHVVFTPDKAFSHFPRWYMENTQRDAIMGGLAQCRPHDTVLVSDVDEIPDPQQIARHAASSGIKVFEQRLCYYYANFESWTRPVWYGTRMGRYTDLLDPGQELKMQPHFSYSGKGLPTYFRFCQGINIPNGGWHFSYCGGVEAVRLKKKSIQGGFDFNGDLSEPDIAKIIRKGRDIHGRDIFFRIRPLSHYPERLSRLLLAYEPLVLRPKPVERLLFFLYHVRNHFYILRKKVTARIKKTLFN